MPDDDVQFSSAAPMPPHAVRVGNILLDAILSQSDLDGAPDDRAWNLALEPLEGDEGDGVDEGHIFGIATILQGRLITQLAHLRGVDSADIISETREYLAQVSAPDGVAMLRAEQALTHVTEQGGETRIFMYDFPAEAVASGVVVAGLPSPADPEFIYQHGHGWRFVSHTFLSGPDGTPLISFRATRE